MADKSNFVHPQTKTEAILKVDYLSSADGADKTRVLAHSYDIKERVDVVSVFGGDGHFHNVSVPWDEYIPLERKESFFVGREEKTKNKRILAKRQGICLFE